MCLQKGAGRENSFYPTSPKYNIQLCTTCALREITKDAPRPAEQARRGSARGGQKVGVGRDESMSSRPLPGVTEATGRRGGTCPHLHFQRAPLATMLRLSAKSVRTEVEGPLKRLLSDPGEGSGGLSSTSILFQLIYGNFRGFLCLPYTVLAPHAVISPNIRCFHLFLCRPYQFLSVIKLSSCTFYLDIFWVLLGWGVAHFHAKCSLRWFPLTIYQYLIKCVCVCVWSLSREKVVPTRWNTV